MMILKDKLKGKKIILASGSPRRQFLLKELGIEFDVEVRETEENHPPHLDARETVLYLSLLKSLAFDSSELNDNTLLITADTVVSVDEKLIGKPGSRDQAIKALQAISGKKHVVTTGVCLRSLAKTHQFFTETDVYFKKLSQEEIEYYVDHYHPYDKAGAYGIQEWIGYIGIEKINGSFYNVMGLPVKALYEELYSFF